VNNIPGAIPHITAGFIMFFIGRYYFKSYFNKGNKFKKQFFLAVSCLFFSCITDFILIIYYATYILPFETALIYHDFVQLIFFFLAIIGLFIFNFLIDIESKPIWIMGMLCILLHITMDLFIPETGIWI